MLFVTTFLTGQSTHHFLPKSIFRFALLLFLSFDIAAQNDAYTQYIRKGDSFLVEERYAEAAASYSAAFQSFSGREFPDDRLNAVRAWSMAGKPDSAYFQLLRIAGALRYGNLEELDADQYLEPIRKDERWPILHALVEKNSRSYENRTMKAREFLRLGNYRDAIKYYSAAFQSNNGKAFLGDRWGIARAWAMSGNVDSVYYHLLKISETELDNSETARAYKYILDALPTDKAFRRMRKDKRWPKLMELANANYYPKMPELAGKLKEVLENDQRYRLKTESVVKQFGRNSAEYRQHYRLMEIQDSMNLHIVTGILGKYGWLGPKEVGWEGNQAIFLVIHHAPLPVMEKYLPKIREAAKKGKAKASDLALFEDRILLAHGKKQIYGSQFIRDPETGKPTFSPIEDVDNVDKRRAMVGLGPIAEYAEHFGGFIWDKEAIEKNRKALPLRPSGKE